jgi:hypothetical protein
VHFTSRISRPCNIHLLTHSSQIYLIELDQSSSIVPTILQNDYGLDR